MNDLNELRRAAKATTNRAFRGSAVSLQDAWLAWRRVIVALIKLAPDNSAQKERLNRLLVRVQSFQWIQSVLTIFMVPLFPNLF